jgi:hypothetical protein
MASIALSSSPVPGYVVVVLRGELDVPDATRFARALSDPSGPFTMMAI